MVWGKTKEVSKKEIIKKKVEILLINLNITKSILNPMPGSRQMDPV